MTNSFENFEQNLKFFKPVGLLLFFFQIMIVNNYEEEENKLKQTDLAFFKSEVISVKRRVNLEHYFCGTFC